MITISRYNPDMASQWDSFVGVSRNPSLLHLRGYIDYHSDRFYDHSLMAWSGNRLLALLPACEEDGTLYSHKGLTFGGWISSLRHVNAAVMLNIWDAACSYMRSNSLSTLIYSPAPWIYSLYPSEDDLYSLFRFGAVLCRSVASSAFPLDRPRLLGQTARQEIARAGSSGILVRESQNLTSFYDVLSEVLHERHGVTPVHSLAELQLLKSRFPEQIRLIEATSPDGVLLAGSIVYISPAVAHTQYMAASEAGRKTKALSFLISSMPELLDLSRCRYIDFGSSCENGGLTLNHGLELQKHGLGGRTVVYNTFRLVL